MSLPPSIRVARGATYLLGKGIVVNIAGIIYFALVARFLPTVADLGRLSALSTTAYLIAILATLALPQTLTRFVARSIGEDRFDIGMSVYGTTLRFGFIASITAAGIGFLSSSLLASVLLEDIHLTGLVELLSIDIFILTITPFYVSSLLALQKFGEVSLIGLSGALLRYSSSVTLLWFGFGLYGVVVGWILGDLLMLLGYIISSRKYYRGEAGSYSLKSLLKFSTPLYGSSVMSFLSNYSDRFLILLLTSTTILGFYTPAVTAVGLMKVLPIALGTSLLPQLSQMYGRSGFEPLKKALKIASRYIFFIYTPLSIGLAATALPSVTLLAGNRYAPSALPMTIISLASTFTSASFAIESVLIAIGGTQTLLNTYIIGIATDIVLCIILVPEFGYSGAALARAFMLLALFIYPALFVRRRFGVFSLDFGALSKSLLASYIMAAVVYAVQLVIYSKFLLPLYIVIGGVVYFILLRSLRAVNREDMNLFRSLLPKSFGGLLDRLEWLIVRD